MNYSKITKFDTSNGPGIRTVLWTQGCPHHCKGCHNPDTWDPDKGGLVVTGTLTTILDSLAPDYIRGLTISGGDPLAPYNRFEVGVISDIVKTIYPNKDIWIWTGYLWEEVKDLEVMDYIDVLVDGPFILEQRDITHPYHGSPNQRVIDVQKSKALNKVVLYQE